MNVDIPKPAADQAQAIIQRAENVKTITITTQSEFDAAAVKMIEWNKALKEIRRVRTALAKPFKEGLKNLTDFFKRAEDACAEAKKIISVRMAEYSREQELLRAEEEAKLRDLQRKALDKLEKQADKLAAQGKLEQAQAIQERAQQNQMFAPEIAPAAVTPKGIKKQEYFDFEIINEHLVTRAYCSPDEKKIRAAVKALGEACDIPGVRVYLKETFSPTGK